MNASGSQNPVLALLGDRKAVLAPMAGVTEAPFRAICKRMGAALTYTEMVSAKGLHYNPDSRSARLLLSFSDEEIPCGVQLFGADPRIMADQAARIVDTYQESVALIDINMGCPVAKVSGKGEGCGLMRTPELAAEIVTEVVRAVAPLPVTAKFRKGWDAESENAVEFARMMEAAGAAAVAVHGRTRSQHYHGEADWGSIAAVKQAVHIPVFGSGDVFSAGDVFAMIEDTGVDAVMVARGAQGNPWIFREVEQMAAGQIPVPPTYAEKIETAREHARELVAATGPRGVGRMRKHVAWYMAGMPGASHVRGMVNEVTTLEELDRLLVEYGEYLAARE